MTTTSGRNASDIWKPLSRHDFEGILDKTDPKEQDVPTSRLRELIDRNPRARLARLLVKADSRLIEDLVRRRQDLDLSQEQVAQRMGVTQSAVARVESGQRDARLSTVRRYALAVDACIRHEVRPAEEVQHLLAPRRDLTTELAWEAFLDPIAPEVPWMVSAQR